MALTERLETLPLSKFHYLLLISAGLGWMFHSMDTGIISFVLPVLMKAWNLSPEQVGTIGSIGLDRILSFICSICFPYVCSCTNSSCFKCDYPWRGNKRQAHG